jgi:hypothetical protein
VEEENDGSRDLATAAAVGAAADGSDDEYEEEEVEVFADNQNDDDDDDDDDTEEVVADDDDEDEYEEVELAAVGDGGSQDDILVDEHQGVFDALDEAERAEGAITYDDNNLQQQSRALPAEPPVYKPRAEAVPPGRDIAKQNCIIAGVLFVGAIAIAALVLPFVLDYPNRNTSGGEPTEPTGPTDVPAPTPFPAPTPSPAPVPPSVPTLAPGETFAPTVTAAPTTSLRFNQFLESFLIPISGSEVFQDVTSPQYRAARYISSDDPYTSELTSVEALEDRYAAITFYYATNGNEWFSCYLNDSSCEAGQWLVNDVCLWFGVGCTEEGRVSSISFGTF